MKIDLKDCTFTIPTKIDSQDRINNITVVLDFINKHFDTNVIICEQDISPKIKAFWKPEWDSFCTHMFVKDVSGLFHKTKLLNIMAKQANTPYIISYDSDVLMLPEQYVSARDILKYNVAYFCYPFCQSLENIPKELYNHVKNALDVTPVIGHTVCPHPEPPPGGCLFMSRDRFMEIGMENENFISYGAEDRERMMRIHKMGFKIHRVYGFLYHLEHVRTPNSNATHSHYAKNNNEYDRICGMNSDQLKQYVRTWPWLRR